MGWDGDGHAVGFQKERGVGRWLNALLYTSAINVFLTNRVRKEIQFERVKTSEGPKLGNQSKDTVCMLFFFILPLFKKVGQLRIKFSVGSPGVTMTMFTLDAHNMPAIAIILNKPTFQLSCLDGY